MGFIRILKNAAQSKRFQTKPRRRREGKTDYFCRRKMVSSSKSKQNTPKQRLCVRISNKFAQCSINWATIEGDHTLSSASSQELTKQGLKVGMNNYAACYSTGLLIARRTLKQLKIDDKFKGCGEATGEDFNQDDYAKDSETRRPFRCILDIGLARSTCGAKVFAVLKGALDGGLNIPHKTKRFTTKEKFDPKDLLRTINGEKVADQMKYLQADDEEAYRLQFGKQIKAGITADKIVGIHKACRKGIRENPMLGVDKVKMNKQSEKCKKDFIKQRTIKLTNEQRKQRVKARIQKATKKWKDAQE